MTTLTIPHDPGIAHGALDLPGVKILSYSAELRDAGARYVGDHANDDALDEVVDRWRSYLKMWQADPFDGEPTSRLRPERLDAELEAGTPRARAMMHRVGEEFALRLVQVLREFQRLAEWRGIERLVVGGGFSGTRLGRHVVARASELSRSTNGPALQPIHAHPDDAGLIGAAHLLRDGPSQGMLAVDLGGTKLRVGLLDTRAEVRVICRRVWRHRGEARDRDHVIQGIAELLAELWNEAGHHDLQPTPVVAIGCPGVIDESGRICSGTQNLPGSWDDAAFNLPACLRQTLAARIGRDPIVVLHNDAVLQGLAEGPHLPGVSRWGVFTIGTGLGNACFARA